MFLGEGHEDEGLLTCEEAVLLKETMENLDHIQLTLADYEDEEKEGCQ